MSASGAQQQERNMTASSSREGRLWGQMLWEASFRGDCWIDSSLPDGEVVSEMVLNRVFNVLLKEHVLCREAAPENWLAGWPGFCCELT